MPSSLALTLVNTCVDSFKKDNWSVSLYLALFCWTLSHLIKITACIRLLWDWFHCLRLDFGASVNAAIWWRKYDGAIIINMSAPWRHTHTPTTVLLLSSITLFFNKCLNLKPKRRLSCFSSLLVILNEESLGYGLPVSLTFHCLNNKSINRESNQWQ